MTRNEMSEIRIRRNKIKRARQLKIRMIMFFATFIIILGAAFGITSIVSKAQNSNDEIKVKEYTSVMVPYGSSLSEIAADYIDYENYDSLEIYMEEVLFINHMNSTDVQAGTYIIMPYFESIK